MDKNLTQDTHISSRELKNGMESVMGRTGKDTKDERDKKLSEQIRRDIENLEQRITLLKIKILGEILNYFKIRKLSKDLERERKTLLELETEFNEVTRVSSGMDRTDVMASELELLTTEKREKSHKTYDVKEVIKKYNIFLTHGFAATKTRANTVMLKEATWKERLSVLIGLAPEISTSSVRDDPETKDKTFYKMGVLLNGGVVKNANRHDAGASARGTARMSGYLDPEDIEKEISTAITQKQDGDYNEIIISDPSIAGIYVHEDLLNPTWTTIATDTYGKDREEVLSHAHNLTVYANRQDMPVYLQTADSHFYKLEIEHDGKIKKGDRVSPEDIIKNNFVISDEQKQSAREKIFDDSPFKLDLTERRAFDALRAGEEVMLSYVGEKENITVVDNKRYELEEGLIDFGWTLRGAPSHRCDTIESCIDGLAEILKIELDDCATKNKSKFGLSKTSSGHPRSKLRGIGRKSYFNQC